MYDDRPSLLGRHLTRAYSEGAARVLALQDVGLRLHAGQVTLLMGPSGSGKSTVARALFGPALQKQEALPDWPHDQSVLDAFPADMPVRQVVELLSSVGFSSPPAWRRCPIRRSTR